MSQKGHDCFDCRLHRRVKWAIGRKSAPHLIKLVNELHELYANTAADLNYDEAILDGSWPTAVEQLERSLEKARVFAAEEAGGQEQMSE